MPAGAPDRAVAAVRRAVREAIAPIGAAPAGDGLPLVLVACSGGPDSLALAAGTAFVAERCGVRAGAVVVDHGWDDDSAARSARVAACCRSLGLGPVDVRSLPPGVAPTETAAREARAQALEDAAAATGATAVLLGHTRDDQAETVLLGLARGSGARSLAGMPARRGILRRPLLGISRAETVRACAAPGLAPWADPANADRRHTRARVRADLLPALTAALGEGVVAALARTADQLRADADLLDLLARDAGRAVAVPPGAGELLALDATGLAALPVALQGRVVHAVLRAAGCPPAEVTAAHVGAVAGLATRWRGQGPLPLPGHRTARRHGAKIVLTGPGVSPPEPPSAPEPPPLGAL
ncbi:MAG: hypoxanthine phosphoribosyltransferase [Mycobacterium sp.]|nr:hypoxanthine phosphoribosyltransferase [Mycobacterium sp.]